MTFKNGIPKIKTKLEEEKVALESNIIKIHKQFQEIEKCKNKIINDYHLSKQKVRDTFNLLISQLKSKENDIISFIDSHFEENTERFTTMFSELEKKICDIVKFQNVVSKGILSNKIV